MKGCDLPTATVSNCRSRRPCATCSTATSRLPKRSRGCLRASRSRSGSSRGGRSVGGRTETQPLPGGVGRRSHVRSEEHPSELQSLMRNSYAVFRLKKKTYNPKHHL